MCRDTSAFTSGLRWRSGSESARSWRGAPPKRLSRTNLRRSIGLGEPCILFPVAGRCATEYTAEFLSFLKRGIVHAHLVTKVAPAACVVRRRSLFRATVPIVRRRHYRRPHYRRHGLPVVLGRLGHSRRENRGHWQSSGCFHKAHD